MHGPYKAASRTSREIGPSRRILGVSPVQSTRVEGIPPGVFPPSNINGIRPLRWVYTSRAVDGLYWFEIFAEVTAIGPAARSRLRASIWSGILTATVDVADIAWGSVCFLGTTQVKGPG